jgi:hypothetical protein
VPVTFSAKILEFLGQSPVHHLNFAECAHHNIGRLQIAVNHAAAMGIRHCLADLLEDFQEARQVVCR